MIPTNPSKEIYVEKGEEAILKVIPHDMLLPSRKAKISILWIGSGTIWCE